MSEYGFLQKTGYDRIANIYDEDMGQNTSGQDIDFYRQNCFGAKGPVLELGCGTGRVTMPLARAGISMLGIDNSFAMLRELQHKARKEGFTGKDNRLRYCCMDMRCFAFGLRFSTIVCPYSAFTYLVKEKDRKQTLKNIHNHLSANGTFLLDVFIPDSSMDKFSDDHIFFDYRRQITTGNIIERTKTIIKDIFPGTNRIKRYYRFFNKEGDLLKTIVTDETIRYYMPDQMKTLLHENGFRSVKIVILKEGTNASDKPGTSFFICRK